MSMDPRPRTKGRPHNKSARAGAAEMRGERTWTDCRLANLVDQVERVNTRRLTAQDLRGVKNLLLLKVKLLVPTEKHHTGLRMSQPVTDKKDQYFGLNSELAAKLKPGDVAHWRDDPLTDEELGEAVENLTGRRYYRETRRRG